MGHRKTAQGENPKDSQFYRGNLESIVAAPRQDHTRIRRVLAQGFSAQAMANRQPAIKTYIDLLIRRLHENCQNGCRPLDMTAWCNWTTFDIFGDLAFGAPFDCLEKAAYHPWVSFIFDSVRMLAINAIVYRLHIPSGLVEFVVPKSIKAKAETHVELVRQKVKSRRALTSFRQTS